MLRSISGCRGGGSGVSASCSCGGGGGGIDVVVVVGGPILVVPLAGGLVLDTAIQEVSSPRSSLVALVAYQVVLAVLVRFGIVGVGVGFVKGAMLVLPVFDVLFAGLPLSSTLKGLGRVVGLVLVVLVVGHFVLDVMDGGRGVSGRSRSTCAVILFQEPPLLEVNRVIELGLGILVVGDGPPVVGDGVGIPSLVIGDVRAALLCSPRYISEAATLYGAPAVLVGRDDSEWFPPGVARGCCARVPRIPPNTAAKRYVMVWLMALRSSRA